MVPEGWEVRALGRGVDLQGGFAFKSEQFQESGIPIVRISSIQDERVYLDDAPCYSEDKRLSRFLLNDGDILIAMSGATTGKTGRFLSDSRFPHAYLNQRVGRFLFPKKGSLDPDFVWQLISTARFQHLVSIDAIGGAQPNISGKEIETLTFTTPPLLEQRKIAQILSTWDRAIEVSEALLATARTQKRALMQSLLTGKRRLPEFEGQEWNEVRFDDVFERVRRKNNVGNENTLTISGQDGLVPQREYFNKRVAAADLSGYTLLTGGDFAYNKSYSAGYPMGAIKVLPDGQTGVVSSLYLCFALTDPDAHCREFFRHFFEAGCFNREIYKIAQEGARNHGLLNVGVHDFFRSNLQIPEREEQGRIAETINLAEEKEAYDRSVLEMLRTEKKALMQQLLTGKRRVMIDA